MRTNNILIFIDTIRPNENWMGLIQMSLAVDLFQNIIVVGNINNIYLTKNKRLIYLDNDSTEVIKYIKKSNLIFGLPSKHYIYKILNIFKKETKIFAYISPGKITKSIGNFKHPHNNFFKKIINFTKYLVPYVYYIVEDFDDAMFRATAFGRDISFFKPIGLPKKITMNIEFSKNINEKKGILFVPTHRWEGKISTISEWLGDDKFVNKLSEFDIYYNNHPDEKDAKVSDKVIKTRELKGSFWKNIDILVTDYSSIAHDFLAAGGKNIIHVTTDLQEFEIHQGKSPLSYDKQFPGLKCNTQDEIIKTINSFNDFSKKNINLKEYSENWFKELLTK